MAFKNWEDDAYERMLAESSALRKNALSTQGTMAGRIFVPKNPWQNLVEGLSGGALAGGAERGQRVLDESRQKQVADWMGQMPSETQEITLPPELEGPVGTIQKTPAQQANEMRQWAAQGAKLPSALAQAAAAKGMDYAMTAPQRQAELEERQAARLAEAEARATSAAELQRVRLEEQARREKERAEERAAEKERDRALRLTMAQIAQSGRQPKMQIIDTVDEKGNPVKKIVELTPGATFPAVPKAASKLDAKTQAALKGSTELGSKLDAALAQLEANPDAVGWKTLIPDLALQRFSSQGERMTRSAIGELSAEKAHDLYGAAFTAAEMKRAEKFLPRDGDSVDTVRDKLKQLKAMVDLKNQALSGGAPSNGGGGGEEWERGPDGKLRRK